MAVTKVSVDEWMQSGSAMPVLDVRSPSEFAHAHIPGAASLPVFNDDERKQIGITYKHTSREEAIKMGLDFFGPQMSNIVAEAEKLATDKKLIVHCWRGGMRSGAMAWLLDFYGLEVYQLDGGYKSFRNWVLTMLRQDYNFKLLGGFTGSGKTRVLQQMEAMGLACIDLEGLAKHKGSAFGGLDRVQQPSTEMFENELAVQLFRLTQDNPEKEIWLEDESQRIGHINMPGELWTQLRQKPLFFLDIPFVERLNFIVEDYGRYNPASLTEAILRIRKRLGGLETQTAVDFLLAGDIKACFEILLKYYDKQYLKALHKRPFPFQVLTTISSEHVDSKLNAQKIANLTNESAK